MLDYNCYNHYYVFFSFLSKTRIYEQCCYFQLFIDK